MSKDIIIEELWQTKDALADEVGKDFENLDRLLEDVRKLPELGPEVDPQTLKTV